MPAPDNPSIRILFSPVRGAKRQHENGTESILDFLTEVEGQRRREAVVVDFGVAHQIKLFQWHTCIRHANVTPSYAQT